MPKFFERTNISDRYAMLETLEVLEDCVDLLEHIHEDLGRHNCTTGCPDIGKRVDRGRKILDKYWK